jgi:DNA-binding IclR family transcriptional regulator
MKDPMRPGSIQVVDRAFRILDLVAGSGTMTLGAMASAARLPPSTVVRIVDSLVSHGFIEKESHTKSYSLGVRLVALGQLAKRRQRLTAIAAPILRSLASETREDVGLSVLQHRYALFADWVEGPEPLKIVDRIGGPEGLYYGAFRKVLLAYQTADWIEDYIAGIRFEKFTPSTIGSRQSLHAELQRIRKQGYALSLGEKLPEAAGIAAPVFGPDATIRASVATVGPISRYTPDRIPALAAAVMRAARAITDELDGVGPASDAFEGRPAPSPSKRRRAASQVGRPATAGYQTQAPSRR